MIMKRNAVRLPAVSLALLVTVFRLGTASAGETLTNADIINLTRGSATSAAIIGRIQSANNRFDLSDEAFMVLKENGVANEVLSAMLAVNAAQETANAPQTSIAAMPTLESLQPPALNLPPLDSPSGLSLPPAFSNPADLPDLSLPSLPGSREGAAVPAPPAATEPSSAWSSAPSAVTALSPVQSMPPPARQNLTPPPAPASPAPSFSPPPAAPAPGGGLNAERIENELANIAVGTPEARRTAMALMLANRDQALPVLRRSLDSGNADMQSAALQVLGAMNDQSSLKSIRALLDNPSLMVRRYAAQALAEMNDTLAITTAEQNLTKNIQPKDGLIRLVGHVRLVRASGDLAAILSGDASALNRAAAAWALAEIGRPGAVAWPALEKALTSDADAAVRREAVRAVAAYHDPESAKLLRDACRRDPQVRKDTLQAMAEYPETVEFLVGVLNLGADQIAPDEVEAARGSLATLTGQDFGLDGSRWQTWFNGNRDRFPSASVSASVAAAPPAPPSGALPGALPGLTGLAAGGSGSGSASPSNVASAGQVDVTTMGIVVDPSQIPMAPEVESRYGASGAAAPAADMPPGGVLRVPGDIAATGPLPGALSPNDFGEAYGPAAARQQEAPPAPGGGMAGVPPGPAGPAAATGPAPYAYGFGPPSREDDRPRGGGGHGAMDEREMWGGSMSGDTEMSAAPRPSLPSVVTPVAPPPPPSDSGASGIRLALPPMTGGDADSEGPATLVVPSSGLAAAGSGPGLVAADVPAGDEVLYPAPEPVLDSGLPPIPVGTGESVRSDPEVARILDQYAVTDTYADQLHSPDSLDETGEFVDPTLGLGQLAPQVEDVFVGEALPPLPDNQGNVISFPGDTDSFGLGEPMFGPGSDIAMPPPPGGGEGSDDDEFVTDDDLAGADSGPDEYDDFQVDGGEDDDWVDEPAETAASVPPPAPSAPPPAPVAPSRAAPAAPSRPASTIGPDGMETLSVEEFNRRYVLGSDGQYKLREGASPTPPAASSAAPSRTRRSKASGNAGSPAAVSVPSGPTHKEWVRGVGLVERPGAGPDSGSGTAAPAPTQGQSVSSDAVPLGVVHLEGEYVTLDDDEFVQGAAPSGGTVTTSPPQNAAPAAPSSSKPSRRLRKR